MLHPRFRPTAVAASLAVGLTFVLLLACAATAPQDAGTAATTDRSESEPIRFGPQFEKGRVTLYEFRADNQNIRKQGETDMIDSLYTEYVMRLVVDDVDEEGVASMTLTFDRMYFTGSLFFGGSFTYDSSNPMHMQTDPNVARALNRLKSSVITFRADPNGKIHDITGFEEACALIAEVPPLQGRENEFNEHGLPGLIESTWRVGDEVSTRRLGEEWTEVQESDVEGIGTWIFTSNYRVARAEPHRVIIPMTMRMDLDFKPREEVQDGELPIHRTEFETQKGNWRYVWDPVRNEIIERRGELAFEWMIEQEPFFEELDLVRTVQNQHVRTELIRIGTEE